MLPRTRSFANEVISRRGVLSIFFISIYVRKRYGNFYLQYLWRIIIKIKIFQFQFQFANCQFFFAKKKMLRDVQLKVSGLTSLSRVIIYSARYSFFFHFFRGAISIRRSPSLRLVASVNRRQDICKRNLRTSSYNSPNVIVSSWKKKCNFQATKQLEALTFSRNYR